jgi:hypothetical protein
LIFFVPAELYALTCVIIFVIFILDLRNGATHQKKEAPRRTTGCHCKEAKRKEAMGGKTR